MAQIRVQIIEIDEYFWQIDGIVFKTAALSKDSAINRLMLLFKELGYPNSYITILKAKLSSITPRIFRVGESLIVNPNEFSLCDKWMTKISKTTDQGKKKILLEKTVKLMNMILGNKKEFPIWFQYMFECYPILIDYVKIK